MVITLENCKEYAKLVEIVKTKGVMGLKGYFKATIHENGEMRVLVDELLPQQPW